MRKPGLFLVLAATVLVSACGPQTGPCPAIAQAPAVSVTVTAGYAPRVAGLHVRACQGGTCKEADVELRAGSRPVDQGCTPEGGCSATSSPDGTKVGVLMLETLTESPMTVTASGTAEDGSALPVRTLEFTPRASYPFGQQCGRVLSASVALDDGGLQEMS